MTSKTMERLQKRDDAIGAWLRSLREGLERRIRGPVGVLSELARWGARWIEWAFRITLWSVLIGGLTVWAESGDGDRGGWWVLGLNWLLRGYLVASSWVFSVEVVRGIASQGKWVVGKTRRPFSVVEMGRLVWGGTMIGVFALAAWVCLAWWLPFVSGELSALVAAAAEGALRRGLDGSRQ